MKRERDLKAVLTYYKSCAARGVLLSAADLRNHARKGKRKLSNETLNGIRNRFPAAKKYKEVHVPKRLAGSGVAGHYSTIVTAKYGTYMVDQGKITFGRPGHNGGNKYVLVFVEVHSHQLHVLPMRRRHLPAFESSISKFVRLEPMERVSNATFCPSPQPKHAL